MPNPFTTLLNDSFFQTFNDAIDAVIAGCETPCKFYYPPTKYIACDVCKGSNLGLNGPNPHIHGGGGRHTGTCSKCNGDRRIPVENSEIVNLPLIWDEKKFSRLAALVTLPDGELTTICDVSLIDKIRGADYIVADTSLKNEYKFVRDGEPTPIDFGSYTGKARNHKYIMTKWTKK